MRFMAFYVVVLWYVYFLELDVSIILCVFLILIYDIFVNCNWVVTRWQ